MFKRDPFGAMKQIMALAAIFRPITRWNQGTQPRRHKRVKPKPTTIHMAVRRANQGRLG